MPHRSGGRPAAASDSKCWSTLPKRLNPAAAGPRHVPDGIPGRVSNSFVFHRIRICRGRPSGCLTWHELRHRNGRHEIPWRRPKQARRRSHSAASNGCAVGSAACGTARAGPRIRPASAGVVPVGELSTRWRFDDAQQELVERRLRRRRDRPRGFRAGGAGERPGAGGRDHRNRDRLVGRGPSGRDRRSGERGRLPPRLDDQSGRRIPLPPCPPGHLLGDGQARRVQPGRDPGRRRVARSDRHAELRPRSR